jgi:membrane fusion protein (multidrug efflux system)
MQSYRYLSGHAGRRAVRRGVLLALALGVAAAGGYGWQWYQASLLPPAQAQDESDGGDSGGNGGGGDKQAESGDGGGGGRPPATVATAVAERKTWRPAISATGSLEAVRGVEVVPDTGGQVVDITFASGDRVEQGQALVRLRSAEARAELKALRARRDQAKSAFERDQRLFEQGNQSEAQLDQSRAQYNELEAEIERQQAFIAKTVVRAPFAGRLGLREVQLGQYVEPGTPLVTLQDLTPLHVNFSLPEQRLPDISTGQPLEVRVDAYPDRVFTGEITAINPKVEEATRQIRVQGTLANDDERLRPGMFTRVSVIQEVREDVVTLPQTAIVNQPYGDLVYVVTPPPEGGGPRRVTQRFVTTGARRGTQVAIVKGLSGGEEVVSAGQIKLRNNAPVRVDNDVQPQNTPTAEPEEP